MDFRKKISKDEVIFVIESRIINDEFCDAFLSKQYTNKKIGIDMKNVHEIKSRKFIELLLDNKFKLFNLKSEVLTYLAIVLKDGFLRSFMNREDFFENKRELIKRRFLIA